MSDVLMTSIVLKTDVTLMDIVSTRMLGQFGFLAQVIPPECFVAATRLLSALHSAGARLMIVASVTYTENRV